MINILLVEDDKDLNLLTTSYLKKAGYNVISTYNGLDALNEIDTQKIDIILSDIMMPLCDGYELAKEVREFNETVPIIFMSARDDKPSKQKAYRVGIDDYITKPFDLDELVLKINAIARRLKIKSNNEIVIGNLVMNNDERTVLINGAEVPFTTREFDILFRMLSFPKKTFTRSRLMEEFWDFDSSATSRTVDVYMAKIRDKIKEADLIEIVTVHGLGYKVVINEKN